jgi:hypothetical protein
VAGEEHGAALSGHAAGELADPEDAVRVETVDRFVEDQGLRVAEQCRGDAEPLPHAEGEPTDTLAGDRLDAGHVHDLVHPLLRDAVRRGQGEQVVVGAAPGVHGLGLEQRPDLPERVAEALVRAAVHRCAAGGRTVEPHDHSHGGRLAGAVRAEEAGHAAGVDDERDVVDRELGSVAFGEVLYFDHRWPR